MSGNAQTTYESDEVVFLDLERFKPPTSPHLTQHLPLSLPAPQISKEDSVERSLQQAKLQRQDKTQDDTDTTATTKHPSQSPDAPSCSPDATTSRSSNAASPQSRDRSGSNSNMELKSAPGKEISARRKKSKPAPIETNLDDPYLPDSDTVALIGRVEDEIVPLQLAVEEETVILSSDEESTLLEK